MTSTKFHSAIYLVILSIICFGLRAAAGQQRAGKEYEFEVMRKINAHGDEFNAVVGTPDGERLIIGSEKGEVIVWNIAANRIERQFHQDSPVLALALIDSGHSVVVAGGQHETKDQSSFIRKWNINTGVADDWVGVAEPVELLSAEERSNVVVGASSRGRLVAWQATSGKQVAVWETGRAIQGLAVIDRVVYASLLDENSTPDHVVSTISTFSLAETSASPKVLVETDGKQVWGLLSASPDRRLLAASVVTLPTMSMQVALIESATGSIRKNLAGAAGVWFAAGSLVTFNVARPLQTLLLGQQDSVTDWPGRDGFHGQGDPSGLSAVVVTADGNTAFGVLRAGAGLARWDRQNANPRLLTSSPANLYAMDILEQSGRLLTGGDDGFTRLWNLSDLSLLNEFKAPSGIPQGVALLDSGKKAVYSSSDSSGPTSIVIANFETRQQESVISVNQPYAKVERVGSGFVYNTDHRLILANDKGETVREFSLKSTVETFSASHNGKWLAATDEKGADIYLFETATGKSKQLSVNLGRAHVVVTNNGQRVYTATEFGSEMKRWDTSSSAINDIGGRGGEAASVSLSTDEKFILIGGNHRDLRIIDADSADELARFVTAESDFLITNAWMSGDRLIVTTDLGVLTDGRLKY